MAIRLFGIEGNYMVKKSRYRPLYIDIFVVVFDNFFQSTYSFLSLLFDYLRGLASCVLVLL